MTAALDALRDEIDHLRREVDDLRCARDAAADIAATTATNPPPSALAHPLGRPGGRDDTDIGELPRSSRRQAIRRLGLATGAAVIGSAAVAGRAAAAPSASTGQNLTAGEINVCTNTTELKMPNNTGAGVNLFSHVLAVQDGVWSTPRVPFAEPVQDANTGNAAVAGFAGSVAMHGGYFQTNHPFRNASAVRAAGESANSYGLMVSGRRAAIRIQRLALQIPPSQRADSHNEGEVLIDDNRDLWYCTAGGSPGTWTKLAGPTAAGQFHPITPARVYDSRYTNALSAGVGQIVPGEARVISVADSFAPGSASPSAAGVVPAGATAIAFNLTIAESGAGGYLSVNPGDASEVTASTINWTAAGTVIANGTAVKLDGERRIKVFCVGSPTHVIIDVAGFYR